MNKVPKYKLKEWAKGIPDIPPWEPLSAVEVLAITERMQEMAVELLSLRVQVEKLQEDVRQKKQTIKELLRSR